MGWDIFIFNSVVDQQLQCSYSHYTLGNYLLGNSQYSVIQGFSLFNFRNTIHYLHHKNQPSSRTYIKPVHCSSDAWNFAWKFLSVIPSVLQRVLSCCLARNACHSHPCYIYHPVELCPSAYCKYSTMQYEIRTSFLLNFQKLPFLLQPVTQEIPRLQEFATSLSWTKCV